MDVRKGRVIFWKKKPNKGPAMVKGMAGDSTVELCDMQRDRFFLVPASEFARFRSGIVFDDKLKLEQVVRAFPLLGAKRQEASQADPRARTQ